MCKISVIVPIYKVEKYLHRCIDSILAQTFTDFELILVDDGSPDNCGKICDEYEKKDSRIIVIHKENGGLSDARNAGLDVAKGRYIYFVDSDDYISSDLLETVIPYMEQGFDMVAFQYYLVHKSEAQKSDWHKLGEFLFNNASEKIYFLIYIILSVKVGWGAWSRVYRRDLIETHHLRFADNKIIFAEDLYFCLCYCAHANRVKSIKEQLYYYVQRDDSIMGQQEAILNAGRMNELGKAVLEHFIKENIDKYIIEAFPVMHYLIIDNVVSRYQNSNSLSIEVLREKLFYDIEDYNFFALQMKSLRKHKNLLELKYSPYRLEEILDVAEFFADGNVFAFKVKCKINDFVKKFRK